MTIAWARQFVNLVANLVEEGVEDVPVGVVDVKNILDEGVVGEVTGGGDDEGGVGESLIPRTLQRATVECRIVTVAHQTVGVEGELPAEDVAVILRPAVDNFDIPGSVFIDRLKQAIITSDNFRNIIIYFNSDSIEDF